MSAAPIPGPNPLLGEFLWTEADLLEALATQIETFRLGPDGAAVLLRRNAATARAASTKATAGRDLLR